ncbi:hypothetical protein [Nocardia sp. NPDC059236]|uniref:hypothetical protein n=1 Tax=Nocardia sp. NPDC059236 TaxID=3346783 RepID=UPI0036BE7704
MNFTMTRLGRSLTRLAIAGAVAAVPLAASTVSAVAEPPTQVAPSDPRTYDVADCDRPELEADRAFQDWCVNVCWANDPGNPANPNSPLNPNNPANPNSPLNQH